LLALPQTTRICVALEKIKLIKKIKFKNYEKKLKIKND